MSNKQAVIIIHGIGEQRPMDTLRKFVKAVWETNTSIHKEGRPPRTYSKPDDISGNLELRRLTTSYNKADLRTDFFEFYWAHMMEGNKLSHVWAWLKRLLYIGPSKLPKPLSGVWMFLVFALVFIAVSVFLIFNLSQVYNLTWLKWLGSFCSLFILPIVMVAMEDYVGDAARYLDSSPKNISRRQKIRTSGIELLKELHDSGEYNRIIVVGHSLGSVIAYDILIHAWPSFKSKIPTKTKLPKLKEITDLLKKSKEDLDLDHYRNLQREVLQEQINKGNDWLVSDLITLGSPLTYADVLLAIDKSELDLKIKQKEFPSCPPQLDNGKFIHLNKKTKQRQLNHDALFAMTRWTNLYFKTSSLIYGDIIGGPLSHLFGKGVKDVPVQTKINGGRFSHTHYWKMDKDLSHIEALREALDLTREFDSVPDKGVVKIKDNNWT